MTSVTANPIVSAPPEGGPIVNAMTVDVEDYFHAQALGVDRTHWERQPRRVERNTHRILDLLEAAGVHGTFFTLAWVAERHRGLIRRIVAAGHELASHGCEHRRADCQTRDALRQDLARSRQILEEVGGVAVRGYRAPTFSIGAANPWAFDVLAEAGYAYSSSIYPVRHDTYGMPEAPRFAFRTAAGIDEYPLTTVRLWGRNLPCAGGGFFRLLPYAVSRAGLARVNVRDRQPAIFYVHPWEIDPGQPRLPVPHWKARFRHYVNLGRTEGRLRRLLADHAWDRLDRVFPPAGRDPLT